MLTSVNKLLGSQFPFGGDVSPFYRCAAAQTPLHTTLVKIGGSIPSLTTTSLSE